MKHTRVVSTKCTPGFACRAFSDTTLVCFIVNEHTTKCSHYKLCSDYEFTKYTSYLALTDVLWGVFFHYFEKKYNDISRLHCIAFSLPDLVEIVNHRAGGIDEPWHVINIYKVVNGPTCSFTSMQNYGELLHTYNCTRQVRRRENGTIRSPVNENYNYEQLNVTKGRENQVPMTPIDLNSYPPGQNGHRFVDDIFRWNFVNERFCFFIKILLKFVLEGSIDAIL